MLLRHIVDNILMCCQKPQFRYCTLYIARLYLLLHRDRLYFTGWYQIVCRSPCENKQYIDDGFLTYRISSNRSHWFVLEQYRQTSIKDPACI